MSTPTSTSRPNTPAAREALVASLRREMAQRFKVRDYSPAANSSGFSPLDALLPHGGLKPGTLLDWLYASPGNGAGTLALLLAARALETEQVLVVIDPQRQFYPPAAVALGVELRRVVLVHPLTVADTLWTWEQALRSPAVGGVWGALTKLEPRTFRRLQVAAEGGTAIGHLIRPAHVQKQPSWAHTQLLVETSNGTRQRVTVTRASQGVVGQWTELDPFDMKANHATLPFPVASSLAHSTLGPRAMGA